MTVRTEHVETQNWRIAELMEHASTKTGRLEYGTQTFGCLLC